MGKQGCREKKKDFFYCIYLIYVYASIEKDNTKVFFPSKL